MADKLKIIAITPEDTRSDEAETVCRILDGGVDYVHIRKPRMSTSELRQYIDAIPESYRSRLTLHDRHELAAETGAGGVHLNRRNPAAPAGYFGRVSRSSHSIAELKDISAYDYVFLSPIYDSISKNGYTAAFSGEELKESAARGEINEKVYALGGITGERLPEVKAAGFGGAAFLGYLFGATTPDELTARLELITNNR